MAVGGDDERHVHALAEGVKLGLFQAIGRGAVLSLGLQHGHGDGLRVNVDLDAEGIVRAALAGLARLAVHDDNGAGGLFAFNQVFSPPALVQRRIDQFCAGICLAEGHFVSKARST